MNTSEEHKPKTQETRFRHVKNIHFIGIGGIGMSGIAEVLAISVLLCPVRILRSLKIPTGWRNFAAYASKKGTGRKMSAMRRSSFIHPPSKKITPKSFMQNRWNSGHSACRNAGRANGFKAICRRRFRNARQNFDDFDGRNDPRTRRCRSDDRCWRSRRSSGSNARLGQSDWFVTEADESDRSFLMLYPTIAVVTNIDKEHMESYKGMDDVVQCFTDFVNKVPFFGAAIICLDDPNVQLIIPNIKRRRVTYGLTAQADISAHEIRYNESYGSTFKVWKGSEVLGEINLPVPGKHNVYNALPR